MNVSSRTSRDLFNMVVNSEKEMDILGFLTLDVNKL